MTNLVIRDSVIIEAKARFRSRENFKKFRGEYSMYYSIGEVSNITGIAISTLRYYDREGMFPDMARNGGIRIFSDLEIDTLKVVECLKASGMSIKSIKQFLIWRQEGDTSLDKRREMFHIQLKEVEKQMETLGTIKNMLKYKCWYYDRAVAAGTEDVVKNLSIDEIPREVRDYKI